MEHEVEPRFHGGFEMREQNNPRIEVVTLAENGLEYGHGSIGVEDRLEDDSDPLTHRDVSIVNEISHSGEALVEVDKDENGKMLDDDGCPDGRETGGLKKPVRCLSAH